MSLRVCLVSPFAWSQPHDVNEHVMGVAEALRRLGHRVTVLAPSTRAADLLAGRRAREPLAGARDRPLRRRPRLRGWAAEPVVPRAPRGSGARGGDLPLAGAARLPA